MSKKYRIVMILTFIMIASALLRYDAFVSTKNRLPINGSLIREGAAIGLYKGLGYRVYPIPNYRKTGNLIDPEEYLQWQENEAKKEKLKPYYLNPGPPTLLAVTYRLFSLKHKYYQIIQLAITWMQILLIYYIGSRIFSSTLSGMIAAFLYSISPYEMNYSLYISREIYVPSAFIVAIACSTYFVVNKKRKLWSKRNFIIAILTGLWIGICMHFKKPSFAWLLIIPIAIFPFVGIKRTFLWTACAFITCFIIIVPWMVRNKIVVNNFALSAESGGLSFWAGIGGNGNAIGQTLTDTVALNSIRMYMRLEGRSIKPFYQGGSKDFEEIGIKRAKQYIRENPNSYYNGFLKNLRENLINYTNWHYYNFWYAAVPYYNKSKKIIGTKLYDIILKTWKRMIEIIPFVSIVGLVVAFAINANAYLLIIFISSAVVSLSLIVGGHCKYAYHILSVHYICTGYVLSSVIKSIFEFYSMKQHKILNKLMFKSKIETIEP